MKIKCELDILSFQYPYHAELKREVLKYLENYPDKQNRTTNVKASMTDWNFTSPQIEKLKDYAISNLKLLNVNNVPEHLRFLDFWANTYSKGDYTISHDHMPSFYSFVYFLKSESNHSPLVFSYNKKKIPPKEGNFVLFPSCILHEVPIHKYEDKRITLSGNIINT